MRHNKTLTYVMMLALVLGLTFAFGCQPQEEEMVEEATPGPEEIEDVEEAQEATAEETDLMVANARLQTADGTDLGTVTFKQTDTGVDVVADLEGIEQDGLHGLHVHEAGECSAPDFSSAGGHYNPTGVDHACPPTTPRHAGDFGNILITDGGGKLALSSDMITVSPGETSVVSKAVILHGGEDDCASQPSGAAGERIACGVIALSGEQFMDEETVEPEGEMGAMDEGDEGGY